MKTRALRRAVGATVAVHIVGTAVSACPICFQFDDATTAHAVSAAVFVLAGVTVAVLIPCGWFAWRLGRRDRPEYTATTPIE